MSIAIVPSMQSRARAMKQAHPQLSEQEIARQLGARTADVKHALQAKHVVRKKPVRPLIFNGSSTSAVAPRKSAVRGLS